MTTEERDAENSAVEGNYANISRRGQAVLIDIIAFIAIFMCAGLSLSQLNFHYTLNVAVALTIVFLMEPLLVSLTGGSIGHHYKGIRVRRADTGRNLNIFQAFIRYLVKNVVGFLSLIWILTTRKHQSLHDLAAGSVVVMSDKSRSAGYIGLDARETEEPGYKYPPGWQRVIVILLYLIVGSIAVIIPFLLLTSEACINYEICNSSDKLLELLSNIPMFICWVLIIIYGWRGKLWGARRKRLPSDSI